MSMPRPRSAFNLRHGRMNEPYVDQSSLTEKSKAWIQAIAELNPPRIKLRPEKAALLVIDMQRFFLDPASPTFVCGGPAIVGRCRKLIEAFRRAERPVIFTQHVHTSAELDGGMMKLWWEGMVLEGSPEAKIIPELAPRPGEKVIKKHRYSAFYNTDLEIVLRCLGVSDLVICGVMTNLCCETTARDAFMRDYRVFFTADGTASVSEEMHLGALRTLAFGFAQVILAEEIVHRLLRVRAAGA